MADPGLPPAGRDYISQVAKQAGRSEEAQAVTIGWEGEAREFLGLCLAAAASHPGLQFLPYHTAEIQCPRGACPDHCLPKSAL
jgi:hypothetical protein